jgi:acyl-coenzyme A thioesterase PaaI-like protein
MTDNRMARLLAKLERLPAPLRTTARSLLMGHMVRFVGTAGLCIEELSRSRAVVFVRNRKPVHNHIGTVHAAVMALIAETASGFVVGMNVPDDRVPVIKSMRIDYVKRASGALRAVAELSPQQIEAIVSTDKGEVAPRLVVTDQDGNQPVVCEMVWAWRPKRR